MAAAKPSPSPAITLGLERISTLLHHLGSPSHAYPIVHVAGTNGKGSVTALIAQMLHCAGYSTGRFNSPHLVATHDSIRINNEVVARDVYATAHTVVEAANRDHGCGCSAFEIQTAVAFVLFRDAGVDVAVVEVGVGGRLDATTACAPPVVCAITAIGMDHADLLGGTIEAIAAEKAGIVRPGVQSVVLGQQDNPAVTEILKQHAAKLGIPALQATAVRDISHPPDSPPSPAREVSFSYHGVDCTAPLSLLGGFQLQNVGTAVRVVSLLPPLLDSPPVPSSAMELALRTVRWPGRLEWVEVPSSPAVRLLVDGAHNEPAAVALGEYVHPRRNGGTVTWILGFTRGKDVCAMLRHLLRPGDVVYTISFSKPEEMPWINCVDAEELRLTIADEFGSVKCTAYSKGIRDVISAIKADSTATVVLCGSLYLVADLYREFNLPR